LGQQAIRCNIDRSKRRDADVRWDQNDLSRSAFEDFQLSPVSFAASNLSLATNQNSSVSAQEFSTGLQRADALVSAIAGFGGTGADGMHNSDQRLQLTVAAREAR
jgi:hypothetical protein